MTRVIVKAKGLQEIVDWAPSIGYSVAIKNDKVIFSHPKLQKAIYCGAASKTKFEWPDKFRRLLIRSIEQAGKAA